MYTLLHIADLHRCKEQPVSNTELVSSLAADSERYSLEQPPIPPPDAIIVSGDMVQGLPLGSPDYPAELKAQYDEALDLLLKLTDEFLDGDRSKVIIVPGNHDVDWNAARKVLTPVEIRDQDVHRLLISPRSTYRWSWDSRTLFKIADCELYGERFKYFCDLYRRFYESARLSHEVDPKRAWNLFTLNRGDILVCGFNSCVNNDCFNTVGEIPAEAISDCHLEMRKNAGNEKLRIAVWHHDIKGAPLRSDYMDQESVGLLLGRGFRIGMHGHHHKVDALPYSIYTCEEETMGVVSTGSLCAGHSELPTGFNRMYTLLVIADNYSSARVQVREMIMEGVFAPSRLTRAGGRSYVDIKWSRALFHNLVNIAIGGSSPVKLLDSVERMIATGDVEEAVRVIRRRRNELGNHARPLLIDILFKGQKWNDLAQEIGSPRNTDEALKLFHVGVVLQDWVLASETIENAVKANILTTEIAAELRARLNAEKRSIS